MDTPATDTTKTPDPLARVLRWVVGLVVGAAILMVAWYGYAYAVTPASLRHPQSAHYHFRLQIINAGQPVNFAGNTYQTPFNHDICTAALTKEPFHFHDQLDQFVHVHWASMTGGLLLKHYGWNFLGGPDNTLGYRFDQFPRLTAVPIHGFALPKPPRDAHYYIYTGSKDSYQERSWNDFLHGDLKGFFTGTKSTSWLEQFIPTASAHSDGDTHSEAELTRLNDVVGSAVIFVQKDKPTDQQIKDRFNHLVPLPESACAG